MMTNYSTLVKRIFIYLSTFWLISCANTPLELKEPKVSLASIEVNQINLRQLALTVNLEVYNPNAFDLSFTDIEYGFYINEINLIEDTFTSHKPLTAKQSTPVKVPITVSLLSSWDVARSILASSQLEYRFVGALSNKYFPVPIKFDHSDMLVLDKR